jgi:glycerol uptake facilitator-like aquaporin
MEGIGSAIVLMALNFSAGNVLVVAMAILGGAVFAGKVSGGHFHSGITLGVFVGEGIEKMRGNLKQTLVMIISQFIGAFAG